MVSRTFIIVELAERSPIIIQLAVTIKPKKFGCTTVRPYKVLFLTCMVNCATSTPNATALFSSPVVSALGSESDDPGSSPSWGKVLCP